MKKRVVWIDWAKTIGILLVVMGHDVAISESILGYISTFHMPLFFMSSGFLFSVDISPRHLLKKNLHHLCLPYFLYNFVWAVLLLIGGCFCVFQGISPDWNQRLTLHLYPLITGISINQFCAPVWFLLSLFWCRIFGNWLFRGKRVARIVLCLLWISIIAVRASTDNPMFLSIDTAAYGMCWFALGYCLRSLFLIFHPYLNVLFVPLGLGIGWQIYEIYGGCSYVMCRPNGIMGIIGTFSTLFGVIAGCRFLNRFSNRVVLTISQSTLFIMCIHIAMLSVKTAICPNCGFVISLIADCAIVLVLSYLRMFMFGRLKSAKSSCLHFLSACI